GWTAGFGTHLWIEQDDGHWVHHAHLDEVLVGVGQRVERGDALGRCGKSGWQKWAHDHAEVCRSRPQSWTQWPRSWSRADVEAVYRNPHEYFAEKQTEADFSVPVQEEADMPDMQGIIDELNVQVAALRTEVDGINGINAELGRQVNSLSWLLSLSQGETHAQAAEVARLQALLAAPGEAAAEVEAVEVRLSGGKVAVLTR
ncbi:MAG TPA: M23 family metallopeptidase, partial [Chloroflexota bacterium]|nr:M23 family metallopeptidase [Chloroflexota bacterium]